ncbi:MAG: M50 family metallopeptidase [Candidatus Obscuribacterales bacterium]|nr:M50 family metallopeptidase [Candidatus Obscuribacterales bacterium]
MNTPVKAKTQLTTAQSFWLLIGIVVLSLLLREVPILNLIFAPFQQFQVMLHELSHAIACVFTGGWVSGLTIVEDGNGHGGLTFTHGGIPFIYGQAGYIGETLWGCALIWLSKFPRLSRYTLMFLGLCIGLASIWFMPAGIFQAGMFFQELGSIFWGLLMAAALFYLGKKSSNNWAHFALLFLAVQSCFSSLEGVWVLVLQSLGAFPGTWSDATNMQRLTGIPAMFWGISWALFTVALCSWTVWITYKPGRQSESEKAALSAKNKIEGIEAVNSKQITQNLEAQIELDLMKLRQSADEGQAIKIKKEERKKGTR